jgi:F0F1-type ATP synthase assembly protein I
VGAKFDLDMEGTCTVRKSTKLLLTMILIAFVHAGILFVWYGRKWCWSNIWAAHIWLLLPSCAAFCLYYLSLSTAGILAEPFRRGKLTTISVVATLVSLYVGVFLSLNTYGE